MSSPGFPMDALHSFGFYSFFRELCRLFLLLIYLYTLFVSYYDQQQDHHPTRRLLVCYTAVFSVVTQRCVTTLKTAV